MECLHAMSPLSTKVDRSTEAAADFIEKAVTCHRGPRAEHLGELDGTEADSYISNPKHR